MYRKAFSERGANQLQPCPTQKKKLFPGIVFENCRMGSDECRLN